MTDLRIRYHKFLNTPASREAEPNELVSYLRPHRIFDSEEEELIRNEATLPLRQYCFFLKLLPTKGPNVKDVVFAGLRYCGYLAAANEWEKYAEPSRDVPDGHIVPVQAELFQAAPAYQPLGVLPQDQARVVEEQGGGRLEAPPEAIRLQARDKFTVQPPQAARPAPPPPEPRSTSRVLAGAFFKRSGLTAATAPSPPPSDRVQEEVVEEELARVVYTGGVKAPPIPHPAALSADLGSAGIPLRTPESFLESGPPSFVPRERVAQAAVEKSLNPKDVQLGDEIGRGFYAVVYVGQYANRKVAVKKFRDYDEFSLAMFIEEVNIMKDLNHRNVVKFIGFVHSAQDRQLWLLTEFVAGGALRRFCTPAPGKTQLEKSLPLRDKVKITIDCWQGLDYIHGKSLCHKDISPGNILVSNDLTQVKISDFGLSEFKNLIMTATTQVSGTPMYYPPEFASENGVIRHPVKSDIYSMGASLCELFSEQWFWNMSGQPRNQFQVMFVLSEAQRLWTEKGQTREPDCWNKVPTVVQPMLKDAITPDYRKRKSAHELAIASKEILNELK